LAEQQRAPSLEVAQVDVVAQRGANGVAGAVDGEHDLRLGVVPLRLRMDPDLGPGAHRRHRLSLGEDLRVGADSDFELLRPHALRQQRVLDGARLRGARTDVAQVAADDRDDRVADGLRLPRVAARLLFDDALEQTGHERDAARLDRLQVARRDQPRRSWIATPGVRVHNNVLYPSDARPAARAPN